MPTSFTSYEPFDDLDDDKMDEVILSPVFIVPHDKAILAFTPL